MFPPPLVMNEISALYSNKKIFSEIINYFSTSLKTYNILEKVKEIQSLSSQNLLAYIKANFYSRLLINSLIEKYKILEKEAALKSNIPKMKDQELDEITMMSPIEKLEYEHYSEFDHFSKVEVNNIIKKKLDNLIYTKRPQKEYA